MQDFVVFDHVCKTYQMGDVRIEALKDASFTIDEGEICVIVGQSGAGKTTLLNILGGMDRLTSGHVLLAGEDVADYSRKRLTTRPASRSCPCCRRRAARAASRSSSSRTTRR